MALVLVFLGGDLAGDLFGTIGLGDTEAAVWRVVRWAVAVGAVLGIYAIVFSLAPDIAARRRRMISPGGLVGVLIWIVASAGFGLYVSNFGRFGATYGAFAGAIILLLWLYISSIAFLFGAELNSVVDRRGGIEAAGRLIGASNTARPRPARSGGDTGEHGPGGLRMSRVRLRVGASRTVSPTDWRPARASARRVNQRRVRRRRPASAPVHAEGAGAPSALSPQLDRRLFTQRAVAREVGMDHRHPGAP